DISTPTATNSGTTNKKEKHSSKQTSSKHSAHSPTERASGKSSPKYKPSATPTKKHSTTAFPHDTFPLRILSSTLTPAHSTTNHHTFFSRINIRYATTRRQHAQQSNSSSPRSSPPNMTSKYCLTSSRSAFIARESRDASSFSPAEATTARACS